VEHVVSYTPVPPLGWALVLEEPWRSATSPLLDYSFAAPLVLIPALLITLLALWFGARRVVQPLRELQSQASALNLEAPTPPLRPVRGIAEIQDLQRTLSLMAMRISSTQQALHSYIGAINRAQEGERGRLARELHDETIQELIALDQRIQLAAIDLHAQASPLADRLDDLHRSATQAIQGVRAMTRGLRPIFLEDLGLLPAIELLIQEARNSLST
jgi:signal transduction histidine kinase